MSEQALEITEENQSFDTSPKRRLYGRRQGRPLRGQRQDTMKTIFPKVQITEDQLPQDKTLDPKTLFSNSYDELWFEIGFGSGEHLSALMERHPNHAFLGAEPFLNGMSNFILDIADKRHDHVRVFMEDALKIGESLVDASVDGIFVLNPDPWPKARHIKRRIISQATLTVFARILKPGAKIIMATDVDYLADYMRDQAMEHPAFKRVADTRIMPQDWIPTRYEEKGREAGRSQTYLIFERNA
jgi:tRNA (guanine-N7-)-methyltransferase